MQAALDFGDILQAPEPQPEVEKEFERRRSYYGFAQFRESPKDPWRFYVSGFGWDDVSCSVLMADGSYKTVPIDSQNRITIRGQKFGRNHWNH